VVSRPVKLLEEKHDIGTCTSEQEMRSGLLNIGFGKDEVWQWKRMNIISIILQKSTHYAGTSNNKVPQVIYRSL